MKFQQNFKDRLFIGSVLKGKLLVPKKEVDAVLIRGCPYTVHRYSPDLILIKLGPLHNAYVNQGLQRALDSIFSALTAQRITHIGLSGNTDPVTAGTTTLGSPNSIIPITNVSRTGQTVHGEGSWSQATVAFDITKIGQLTSSAATAVCNIIGGTGGSAPYDEPFNVNLVNISNWDLTMGIDTTLTAS